MTSAWKSWACRCSSAIRSLSTKPLKTNVDGIYVIGDVVDGPMHCTTRCAIVLARPSMDPALCCLCQHEPGRHLCDCNPGV